jgi:SNF family Na+-dependent transporter
MNMMNENSKDTDIDEGEGPQFENPFDDNSDKFKDEVFQEIEMDENVNDDFKNSMNKSPFAELPEMPHKRSKSISKNEKGNGKKTDLMNGEIDRSDQENEQNNNAPAPEVDPHTTSDEFGSSVEYWLSVIGYAVGFGNVWRFPYLLYENGGGAFLIPYFFSLFLICIPLFLLETAYGQLTRLKPHKFFSSISPKLAGFTYAQLFMGVVSHVYYVVLLMWSVAFLFNSFSTPLPWETSQEDEDKGIFWNEHYFTKELIQSSDGINDTGHPVLEMVIALAVSWILVYICIFKGIESSGKIVYVTAPLPYILLFILLIRGLTLDGAFNGIYYLFVPDFSKVMKIKAWRDAINQIIFSSSLGGGTLILYGSYRKKTEKVMISSVIVPIINSATSILAALVLFSFLGHMAHKFDMDIDDIPIEGLQLAFVAYPALLTQLPGSNFWAVLFFIMLVTVGIDSLFGSVDTIVTMLHGIIKKYKWVPGKEWITIWY